MQPFAHQGVGIERMSIVYPETPAQEARHALRDSVSGFHEALRVGNDAYETMRAKLLAEIEPFLKSDDRTDRRCGMRALAAVERVQARRLEIEAVSLSRAADRELQERLALLPRPTQTTAHVRLTGATGEYLDGLRASTTGAGQEQLPAVAGDEARDG